MKKLLIIPILFFAVSIFGCSTEESPSSIQSQNQKAQKKQRKNAVKSPATTKNKSQSNQRSNAVAMFKRLRVADEIENGYERDLFEHWSDLDGNGCDTREDVLARDSRIPNQDCSSDSGSWVSAYDRETTTDAGDFDIDHMVPLAEAWASGAYAWDDVKREAYANDMHPFSLIAVSASSNRSKSDQDPAEWMPENTAFRCAYVARWIAVKFRWRLTIDPNERNALASFLSSCSAKELQLDQKAPVKPVNKSKPVPQPKPKRKISKRKNSIPSGGSKKSKRTSADPRFDTCSEAIAKGYGNYKRGRDKEYVWYRDADSDGFVCET